MAERLADRGADVVIHDRTWDAPSQFGEAPDLGMAMSDVEALLQYTDKRRIGWAAWIFDSKGPPALLASRDGTPTVPYGATVKAAMLTTPAVPP